MDKATIEALSRLAIDANKGRILEISPTKNYVFLNTDGSATALGGQPEPRDSDVMHPSSIVAWANECPRGEVWYSRNGVRFFPDRGQRTDIIAFGPSLSGPVVALQAMETTKAPVSQDELRAMLRTTFYGVAPPELVSIVSALRFETQAAGNSEIARGKSSVGKSIRQEVSGMAELPEYVDFRVTLHDGAWRTISRVKMFIDVNPATVSFRMFPLPGELDRAFVQYESEIEAYLREHLPKDYPLFYGNP